MRLEAEHGWKKLNTELTQARTRVSPSDALGCMKPYRASVKVLISEGVNFGKLSHGMSERQSLGQSSPLHTWIDNDDHLSLEARELL